MCVRGACLFCLRGGLYFFICCVLHCAEHYSPNQTKTTSTRPRQNDLHFDHHPLELLTLTGIGQLERDICFARVTPSLHSTSLHSAAARTADSDPLSLSNAKASPRPRLSSTDRTEHANEHTYTRSLDSTFLSFASACTNGESTNVLLDVPRLLRSTSRSSIDRRDRLLDTLTWHRYSTIYMTTRIHCCSTLIATRTRA